VASGLLRVSGTIDLSQFWPTESSDADTSKIKVDVTGSPFEFRPQPGAAFQVTNAFTNATVRGSVEKPAIDKNNRITVRLQGIDAPELHYRPKALLGPKKRNKSQNDLYLQWNLEYRQYLAETATIALTALLQGAGQNPLPCRVESKVDEPNEVFDTYARFVGDIIVTMGGQDQNINHWLLKQGWAFPAFYASMSSDEITELTGYSDTAYQTSAGVWGSLDDYAAALDWNLVYRGKGAAPNPNADKGGVLVPKLFRRLSAWAVNKRAGMASGTFLTYLKAHPDVCYLTEDFLVQGPTASPPHKLDEFVEADGFFNVWPEQIIFHEKPSKVTGPGGAPVMW